MAIGELHPFVSFALGALGQSQKPTQIDDATRRAAWLAASKANPVEFTTAIESIAPKTGRSRWAQAFLDREFDSDPPEEFRRAGDDPVANRAREQARVRLYNFMRELQMDGATVRGAAERARRSVSVYEEKLLRGDDVGGFLFSRERNLPSSAWKHPKTLAPVIGWTDLLARSDQSTNWPEMVEEFLQPYHDDGFKGGLASRPQLPNARAHALRSESPHTAAALDFATNIKAPPNSAFRPDEDLDNRLRFSRIFARALSEDAVEKLAKDWRGMAEAIRRDDMELLKQYDAAPNAPRTRRDPRWTEILKSAKDGRADIRRRETFAKWLEDAADLAEAAEVRAREPEQQQGRPAQPPKQDVVVPKDAQAITKRLYGERLFGDGRTANAEYKKRKVLLGFYQKTLLDFRDEWQSRNPDMLNEYKTKIHQIEDWVNDFPRIQAENARRLAAAQAAIRMDPAAPQTVLLINPVTRREESVPHSEVFEVQRPPPAPPAQQPPARRDDVSSIIPPAPKGPDAEAHELALEQKRKAIYGPLMSASRSAMTQGRFSNDLANAVKSEGTYFQAIGRKDAMEEDLSEAALKRAREIVLNKLLGDRFEQLKEPMASVMKRDPASLSDMRFDMAVRANASERVAKALPSREEMNRRMADLMNPSKGVVVTGEPEPTGGGNVNVTQLITVYNDAIAPIYAVITGNPVEQVAPGEPEPPSSGPVPPKPASAVPPKAAQPSASAEPTAPYKFVNQLTWDDDAEQYAAAAIKRPRIKLNRSDCVDCKVLSVRDLDTPIATVRFTKPDGTPHDVAVPIRIGGLDAPDSSKTLPPQPWIDDELYELGKEHAMSLFRMADRAILIVTPTGSLNHGERLIGDILLHVGDTWHSYSKSVLNVKVEFSDGRVKNIARKSNFPFLPRPDAATFMEINKDPKTGSMPVGD